MKNVERSQTFLRKRKMMLVLPLLVIPFLTMAFWAMGGGKGKKSLIKEIHPGLNLHLPEANLQEDRESDKLSFYDKADKDSMKFREWMRSDPYYMKKEMAGTEAVPNELEQLTETTATKFNQSLKLSPHERQGTDPGQKIMQKIAQLESELNKPPAKNEDLVKEAKGIVDPVFSSEINRLENLMGMMNNSDTEDPDMKQLEGTLEKILDIQHPERVKDRLREKSLQHKEIVFAVSKQPKNESISLMDTNKKAPDARTGFYGLSNESAPTNDNNSIEAVVHETQTLVNGAVIKLRLLNDIFINGTLVPAGNFIYGVAALNDERLTIDIPSIRHYNYLFPVKLEVYDMDGLPGIYIPGAITRDVAKHSADNSLPSMELHSMDPSFKVQAASAGIGAAKNLLSKKVKLVKVLVKAGYKVLLKDKQ